MYDLLGRKLSEVDPEVARILDDELSRQQETLELIASENFVPWAVLAAQGSVLTNKYAEGYPGRRYYGGCEHIDRVESLAIERAKQLFGAEHANVQPHSGSSANMAAYVALAPLGSTIMGMNLAHGGHLTHGSPVSFSGRWFNIVSYGVKKETGTIDYDQMVAMAREHRPKIIIAGGSAYPREIDFAPFREIADEIGAHLVVDMAHFAGLVAAGLHNNPVPLSDVVTSTTHKTLRGPRSGFILSKAQYAKAIDSWVFPGLQGGPLEHVIAAKAVCFGLAMKPEFREYQRQIVNNARALADELMSLGYQLVSGGTDTHLMLVDLQNKGITGKQAEQLLERCGITVNKNMVPFDPKPPAVSSGIRIGTPAVTSRGMKEPEMRVIARLIDRVLSHPDDESVLADVRSAVLELTEAFPLYKDLPRYTEL